MKIMSAERNEFFMCWSLMHIHIASGCEMKKRQEREENKQHKFKRNDNLNSIKLTHQLQAH